MASQEVDVEQRGGKGRGGAESFFKLDTVPIAIERLNPRALLEPPFTPVQEQCYGTASLRRLVLSTTKTWS